MKTINGNEIISLSINGFIPVDSQPTPQTTSVQCAAEKHFNEISVSFGTTVGAHWNKTDASILTPNSAQHR
jgi:hypothetical protein